MANHRYSTLAAAAFAALTLLAPTTEAQRVSIGGSTFSSGSGRVNFSSDGPGWDAQGTVKHTRSGGRRSLVLTNFRIRNKTNRCVTVNICMWGLRFKKRGKVRARFWMRGQFRGPNTGNAAGNSSVTMTAALNGTPIPPPALVATRGTGSSSSNDTINEASPIQRRELKDPTASHQLSAKLTFKLYPNQQVRFPHSAWVDVIPAGGQGTVAPTILGKLEKRASLAAPVVPGKVVERLHMVPHPKRRGQFLTAMTVRDLATSAGGTGSGLDLLTGTYDAAKDKFTADKNAAALNTSAAEEGLSLHESGTLATYRVAGRGVYFTSRPSPDAAFAAGTLLPETIDCMDPALANVDKTLQLIWADSAARQIQMSEIDLGTMTVGDPLTIVTPTRFGGIANTPNPIVDHGGNLIGVSYQERVGSDNDHYVALDLDLTTPSVRVFDYAGSNRGGCFAGGRFFYVDGTSVTSLDTYWFTGGSGLVGGPLTMTAYAPPGGSYFSLLMGSADFLPVPLPKSVGDLAVFPHLLLPIGPHDPLTGASPAMIPLPPSPGLQGLSLATQALTFDVTKLKARVTNSATLRIE